MAKKKRGNATARELLAAIDALVVLAERIKRLRRKLNREPALKPGPAPLRIAAESDDDTPAVG